jgi:ankyrin repeat protein
VNCEFSQGEHDLNTLKCFTEQGVDIDALTLNGCTGLWLLARCHKEQDTFACDRLVALVDEQEAALQVRTPKGWGLLHAAAAAGGTTMLQLLLDRGLVLADDVEDDTDFDNGEEVLVTAGRTHSGATVLHCAVRWAYSNGKAAVS